MMKYRMLITAMMLGAVVCLVLGRDVFNLGMGMLITYPRYITAFFPADDSSWRLSFVIFVRLLVLCGVAASALIWVRKPWAAIASAVLCLCPSVWCIVSSVMDHFNPFAFDNRYHALMLLLPLASAVLCVPVFLGLRREKGQPPAL